MIKGVLFDMDGVLIDSEPAILHAAIKLFGTYGASVKPEDFVPFIGAGDKRYILGVAEKYGIDMDYEVARVQLYQKYREEVGIQGAMPGVIRFLNNLRKAGVKIALASSATEEKILINLSVLGVDRTFFDSLISGDKVARNKPDPDIYQLAGLSMGVPLENCLVVEDAINGVMAGKAAGARVLAVTNTFPEEKLWDAGCDICLSSLDLIEDFSTIGEFNREIDFLTPRDERVLYGAVRTKVRTKKLLDDEILMERAHQLALKVREHAYAPYSGFRVGAAVVSCRTGNIYTGCNVENSSYGGTICAERNAILHMIAEEGPVGIDMVVVVADSEKLTPPCAMCLQVIAEFARKETAVGLYNLTGDSKKYRFEELLPEPFVF